MDLRLVKRLALIVMALFPALWGLLGDLNNVTDFSGTATNAVAPMIAMTNTYGNPLQTWRAITAPWAAPVGLSLIMAVETAAGVARYRGRRIWRLNWLDGGRPCLRPYAPLPIDAAALSGDQKRGWAPGSPEECPGGLTRTGSLEWE